MSTDRGNGVVNETDGTQEKPPEPPPQPMPIKVQAVKENFSLDVKQTTEKTDD